MTNDTPLHPVVVKKIGPTKLLSIDTCEKSYDDNCGKVFVVSEGRFTLKSNAGNNLKVGDMIYLDKEVMDSEGREINDILMVVGAVGWAYTLYFLISKIYALWVWAFNKDD